MPLPTSDLLLEMKALREAYNQFSALTHHEQLYQQHQHHHPRLRPQLSQNSSQLNASARAASVTDSKAQSEDKASLGGRSESSHDRPMTQALNLSPALIPQRSQHHLAGEAFSFRDAQPGPLTDKPLNKSADLASLDSSDTYASCQTHPCLSQGDLATSADDLLDCNDDKLYNFDSTTAGTRTASIMDFLDYDHTNQLYVNPLQKSDSDAIKLQKKLSVSSIGIRGNISTGASPRTMSQVKKSASGGFNGGGGGKYSNMNDLVSTLIKARDVTGHLSNSNNSNNCNPKETSSSNLIEGLDGGELSEVARVSSSSSSRDEAATVGGLPKHRKTRFQQQLSGNSDGASRKSGDIPLTTANLMTASQMVQDGFFMSPSGGGGLSTSSGGSSSTITGSQVSVDPAGGGGNNNPALNPSASVKVKCRRASFMPARSLASATKKINQHLFGAGPGTATASGAGTSANTLVLAMQREAAASGKKSLSMSTESIDSDATATLRPEQPQSPRLDAHRRSKSILKNKGERLPNKFGSAADPENERLLMDNSSSSAIDNGVGCDCEYSPQRTMIHAKSVTALSMTPKAAAAAVASASQLRQPRPLFVHQRSTPDATISASPKASSTTAKYQSPRHTETELATIRQHRQQKMFKETALEGGSFGGWTLDGINWSFGGFQVCANWGRTLYLSYLAESESTVQSVVGDRDEGFGGADENRSLLLERKLSAVQQQKKHQSSS